MKRATFVTVALLCLVFVNPVIADEFGVGGAWVDGHSKDGGFAINNEGNQSWGVVLHYDRDMLKKEISKKLSLGLDPGAVYMYFHWTKNIGQKSDYTSSESVNSHIVGASAKPYIELYGKLRLFGLGGGGMEFNDDGDQDPALFFGGGIQYRFTKHLASSLTQYEVFADPFDSYRRYDTIVFSVELLF